jgi:hypothetical protein
MSVNSNDIPPNTIEAMKATYRISEKDYAKALILNGKLPWWRVGIGYLGMMVCMGGVAALAERNLRHILVSGISAALGGFLCILIILMLRRYIDLPVAARRRYRRYKIIHEEFRVELLSGGIRIISASSAIGIVWENIWGWRQNENYILIYLAPNTYYILPKSIAASGFDVPLLIEQLTEHVGKPK